jgi:hypothetical protein
MADTFIGTYSDAVAYARGDVVAATAGGVLWRARANLPVGAAVEAPYFENVSAVALELLHADLVPSADDGVDAAIGSTFVDLSTGFYVKTAGSAGDWTIIVEPS